MSASVSRRQLRDFGLLIGVGFPLLIGWILPAITGHGFRGWTLWIGLPALILGLTAPGVLRLPYRGWMALGHALGWVNSHIILGLVFVLVLQPIALIMKAFHHDPLRRKRGNALTYREVRNNHKVDLTRIF